jgi:hypothetical protein
MLGVLAGSICVLSLAFLPSIRITAANYDRIQVGMTQAELYDLLGPPESQTVELALAEWPETFVVNFSQSEAERRRRGFRDCRREQWVSSYMEIIVVSDLEGRVVCRYTGPGRKPYWLLILRSWLRRWL